MTDEQRNSFDEMNAAVRRLGILIQSVKLLAIGASTGGPKALRTIFEQLPADFPVPIVVAQHMSPGFMESLAAHLNDVCALHIVVAEDGMTVRPGTAYLAPDGKHMLIQSGMKVKIINFVKGKIYIPSVDILFQSVAETVGEHAIGVLLTGMGNDGAKGLLAMRKKGAYTIAESEETAVVFGMPRIAIEKNAVSEVLAVTKIADRLKELVGVSIHE